MKKDFTTGKEGLTLAAILIFGKDVSLNEIQSEILEINLIERIGSRKSGY